MKILINTVNNKLFKIYSSITSEFLLVFQVFCFVPFYDNHFNKMRLERIRSNMKLNIELMKDIP